MNKLIKAFFTASMVLFASSVFAANTSPVGFWQTIDDVTNKPKAIIEITETPQHALNGKVVKILSAGHEKEVCSACEDEKHNQPIVGMTILENLSQNKENQAEWNDGKILDPKNGKVYSCTVTLLDNGQRLNVKGYIGLPLLGRTQTWNRVEQPKKS